jgi:hypothetical protein
MKRGRKRKKRSKRVIAIGIGALILCAAGFIVYTQAKNIGFTEGKRVGYAEGYDKGYENGYISGRESGYEDGHAIGYQRGYDEGYECGHDNGYREGYNIGYTCGYDNGLELGRGHGYTIKDPTYLEMRSFIQRDQTNKNDYLKDVYTCENFAADVCNHAEEENIRCAFVVIHFPEGGHAIVAFDTVDRGLIFIEPQRDEEMEVEVGKPYGSLYTVTGILIVW